MPKTIINKGNYTLETEERELKFNEFRGAGWSEEYHEYRRNWDRYPINQIVSDYPLLVDVELSSICNLKCPMCYTITDDFKKKVKAGLMDFNLYKKIIDEIGGKVPAIRLSLRGEPTLHPSFIDCIKYAKLKGINEISFLTNASKLDSEFFQSIMEAGASWITVSIDGLNEEYEKIRRPLKFNETFQKIKDIKKIKDKAGVNIPVIKIQSIWPAIQNGAEQYYNTFIDYVDYIAFNPLIEFHKSNDDKVYLEDFYCPMHYQRIVVGADGVVMMCSNDEENIHPIGDANKDTIHNIWHGEKLQYAREIHKKKGGYREFQVCKNCYLPVKTEDNERVVVNGREIIIRNYIYSK